MAKKNKKKLTPNQKAFRIISVAALCFSIVSWKATSDGLKNYVFAGWQALMVSFGIQSILFVINLKMPQYIHDIPYKKDNYKGWNLLRLFWRILKNTIINLRFIVAIFYILILMSSSVFSYIYIVNSTYKDTRYYDANIELDENFQIYCSEAQSYAQEYSNQLLQKITDRIEAIDNFLDENKNDSSIESKSDLELQLKKKNNELESLKNNIDYLFTEYQRLKDIADISDSVSWRSAETHERERSDAKEALDRYNAEQNKLESIQNEIAELEQKFDDYKEPATEITQKLTLELSGNRDLNTMQELVTNLYNELDSININNSEKNNGYTTDVNKTISDIKQLNEMLSEYDKIEKIITILNNLSKNQVVSIPNSKSSYDDISDWSKYWSDRYENLLNQIENMPNNNEFDGYRSFNKDNEEYSEKISEIYDIQRKHLYNISEIEKAYNYFKSKYPLLSYFSIIFAIFLDIASLMVGLFLYYMSKPKQQTVSTGQSNTAVQINGHTTP